MQIIKQNIINYFAGFRIFIYEYPETKFVFTIKLPIIYESIWPEFPLIN